MHSNHRASLFIFAEMELSRLAPTAWRHGYSLRLMCGPCRKLCLSSARTSFAADADTLELASENSHSPAPVSNDQFDPILQSRRRRRQLPSSRYLGMPGGCIDRALTLVDINSDLQNTIEDHCTLTNHLLSLIRRRANLLLDLSLSQDLRRRMIARLSQI